MLRLSAVITSVLVSLCAVVTIGFAQTNPGQTPKPIDDVKALAGDWRSVNNVTPASIHISENGVYEGIAATGAKTSGRIIVTSDKATYLSTTSAGYVTLSQESGNDVLTFHPRNNPENAAKLERIR
jgi:hypothetical protein